jgi:hypothetical protein
MGVKDTIRKRVNDFLNAERDIPQSREQQRDAARKAQGGPAFEAGITPSDVDVWNWYESSVSVERDLKSRYLDYESMDDYPDFSAALDTWADESTQPDQMKKVAVWVESPTHAIAERGNEVLDIMGVEKDIWGLSRGLAKYGDQYGELLLNDDGVVGVQYLDAPTVRVVAESGREIGYVQDPEGTFKIGPTIFKKALAENQGLLGNMALFHPWEVVHWKLMLRRLRGLYGHGIGEPVRWLHKRVIMLEDSAVLFKITRAPVRTAYYVACGEIPPEKRLAYVKQVKSQFRRKQYKSPDGKVNFAFNPMNPHEEYWLPAGGGQGDTRIESIGGSDFQAMELLEYMQAKYHMALKVPRTHMGFAGEPAQAMLAQIDVKFARAVLRLQASICHGFDRVIEVDLMARNIDPATVKYGTRMTMPSSIFELARMEVWNARADLMSRIGEQMPLTWMLMNIVGLSEDESAQVIALKQYEKRMVALWDARSMADAEKIQSGAGGDSGGGGGGYESVELPMSRARLHEERVLESRFKMSDERRVLGKVNALLEQNAGLAHRLRNLNGMLREIYRQTVLK